MNQSLDRINILLVEDYAADAELVQSFLAQSKQTQFNVSHVRTLKDADEALEQGGFDIILLDLSLPDSFGFDTFEHLHALAPRTAIVVLTGYNDESLPAQAIQRGAQDYLPKYPLTGPILIRTIRHAIERQKLVMQLQAALTEVEQLRNAAMSDVPPSAPA
ncbi:MAG TPA: response regulator [Desulfuromonadaceae bacterium]|nr:response regulator [Desulfuromonadaceae bacterium]